MKSDTQIQLDVMDELQSEPRLRDSEISVAVTRGAVTLRGVVYSPDQKKIAEHRTKYVDDVRAIALDLHLLDKPGKENNDTRIAASIVDILTWDPSLRDENIRAIVDAGRVTLEGEVTQQHKKEAAINAINCISDIREVSNLITVKNEPNNKTD